MTRTIELPIPEELLRLVDERAQTVGHAAGSLYSPSPLKGRGWRSSLSETLAPFRRQVAGSGIGDDELDRLFSQARDESYRARRPRPADER